MTCFTNEAGIGDKIASLVAGGKSEVVLVAPFIKVDVLEKILMLIPSCVSVHCVTRWKPDEIALGVSDIEIWPLLTSRRNARLQLHPRLHAKYYRADDGCIIGSANLTQVALAWSPAFNLELMVQVKFDDFLMKFEQDLFELSTSVDDTLYLNMLQSVGLIKSEIKKPSLYMDLQKTRPDFITLCYWFPRLRHPQDLYSIYTGNTGHILESSIEFGEADLANFEVPASLSEEAFNNFIKSMLIQQPIVKKIDEFLNEPKRFGAMTEFVKTLYTTQAVHIDAVSVWQTLMRWLTYFAPDRYAVKVPNYSEVFYRLK